MPSSSFHSRTERFCRRASQVSLWWRIHLPSRRCRSGRSPGEGNDYPLQCSCLGKLTDREAWQTPVHGVTNSRTRLSEHILNLWSVNCCLRAPHSSTLAWKILWTEELGGLQSMGSLRVRHDWATSLSLFTFMHWRKWHPTPVFLPGESQGRGSLVGCRLWGRTELDMTEVT